MVNWLGVAGSFLAGVVLALSSFWRLIDDASPVSVAAWVTCLGVCVNLTLFVLQQSAGSVIAGYTWESWKRYRGRSTDSMITLTAAEHSHAQRMAQLAAHTIAALAAENKRLGCEIERLERAALTARLPANDDPSDVTLRSECPEHHTGATR